MWKKKPKNNRRTVKLIALINNMTKYRSKNKKYTERTLYFIYYDLNMPNIRDILAISRFNVVNG